MDWTLLLLSVGKSILILIVSIIAYFVTRKIIFDQIGIKTFAGQILDGQNEALDDIPRKTAIVGTGCIVASGLPFLLLFAQSWTIVIYMIIASEDASEMVQRIMGD